jgi:hypothetical protein
LVAVPPAFQVVVLPIDLRPPFPSRASVPVGLVSVLPESVPAVPQLCLVWVVEQVVARDCPRDPLNDQALVEWPPSPFRRPGSAVVVAGWAEAA